MVNTFVLESDDTFEVVPRKNVKSTVWTTFGLKRKRADNEEVPGIAVCIQCRMEVKYSGGTTNLQTHISRHHKSVGGNTTTTAIKTELNDASSLDINDSVQEKRIKQRTLPGLQAITRGGRKGNLRLPILLQNS